MLVAVCVGACGPREAFVEDYVLGGSVKVITVDGRPATRAQSKYVTVVPLVVVDSGLHTFRVAMTREGSSPETVSVSATVVAGRRYRFEEGSHRLELVEHPKPTP